MERRPEFTIIAGPNGAGKSRLCPFYVSTTSFDGNSEYGQIIALHISKSHTHKVVDSPPLWFREQFEDCFNAL